MLTLAELKERIVSTYDPELVTEVLELSTEQLLDAFEEKLIAKRYKFEDLEDERTV
jgi:hypothetical protein